MERVAWLTNLNGLAWLVITLLPLLVLQRWLHREIQLLFFLITRRIELAIALFSLCFFPGILLHEGSHYIFARMLGVKTGRISLLPQPLPDGRLQLGYVETYSADWLRDAVIGAAPLLVGGTFVAYVGIQHLGFEVLWKELINSGVIPFIGSIPAAISNQDFWLWFYLVFVVSSTMLPSSSDRRAWLPLGLVFVLLLGISLLAGAGPWLASNLAIPFNLILKSIAIVFGISVFIHIILLFPIWGLRILLGCFFPIRTPVIRG